MARARPIRVRNLLLPLLPVDLDLLIRDPSPCRLSPVPPEEDAHSMR